MTLEDIKRAQEGSKILMEIEDCQNYIIRIKNNTYPLHTIPLDEDLLLDAVNKQCKRYETRLKELQKQFDEL